MEILKEPNPILRKPTQEVENFDMGLQNLIDEMVKSMRENNGVGLAAPQVGISQKILVCEYEAPEESKFKNFPLTVLTNPQIIHSSKEHCKMVEGCLSFPGMELVVERPKKVIVIGKDRYGKDIKIEAEDIQGRVLQHEIDHLNSTLLVDHLKEINLVIFATGDFAQKTLEYLVKDPQYNIKLIVTGNKIDHIRGKKINSNQIYKIAKKNKIKTLVVDSLKDQQTIEILQATKADLGIVIDYGEIIGRNIIDIFHYGIINVHPSLLPKYRGTSPIQSSILSGDKKTGVTVMLIDEGMDSGPILSQQEVKLTGSENFKIIYDFLAELGASLLMDTIPYYIAGEIKPIPQDHQKATYTKKIKKQDGLVDKNTPEKMVERMVRAFDPWPKVYTNINDNNVIITSTHLDKEKNLVIDRLKPAGRSEISYDEYIRNYKTKLTFKK